MKKLILTFFCALATMALFAQASVSETVDCGNSVTIKAIPNTGYHFVEWNDHNTEDVRQVTPSADVTYTAHFAINEYTITFQNWNGSVLQTDTYKHGDAVSYDQPQPTKESDVEHTYTFAGWSPTISSTATENVTYVAQFEAQTRQYTITFKNYDGTILESKKWDYGSTPSYDGTPTRAKDDENTYTFAGWDKAITSVTDDKEYIATFSTSTNSYAITTAPTDGLQGITTGGGTYLYGATVTIKAVAAACYEFDRWSDGDTNAERTITVTGSATYTAIFRKIQYTVTVVSDNNTQGTVSVSK